MPKNKSRRGKQKKFFGKKYNIIKVPQGIVHCCNTICTPQTHYDLVRVADGKLVIEHYIKCRCGNSGKVNSRDHCLCCLCAQKVRNQVDIASMKIVFEKCAKCKTTTPFIHSNGCSGHRRECSKCGTLEKINPNFLDEKKPCSCGYK